jgi:hypothetical protein
MNSWLKSSNLYLKHVAISAWELPQDKLNRETDCLNALSI